MFVELATRHDFNFTVALRYAVAAGAVVGAAAFAPPQPAGPA
jgi:hypothetical protein